MSAGFSFFPEDASDGRGSSAILCRGGRKNLSRPDVKQCQIPHRSVRKILSNKTGRKKFFLTLFLLSQNRAARFSPSLDVITFQAV